MVTTNEVFFFFLFLLCLCEQINAPEVIICVVASQIANFGESIIGAALQDKEGFRWVGNHLTTLLFCTILGVFSLYPDRL